MRHIRELYLYARPSMRQQSAVGPGHILGRDRCAVGKMRLGPNLERHPHLVRRQFDCLCQVPVAGGAFIRGTGQQTLPHMSDGGARSRSARQDNPGIHQPEGGRAAQDKRIEAVECAQRRQVHRTALRRVGIDVGEMREIRRQCWFPQYRQSVASGDRAAVGPSSRRRQQQQEQTG